MTNIYEAVSTAEIMCTDRYDCVSIVYNNDLSKSDEIKNSVDGSGRGLI